MPSCRDCADECVRQGRGEHRTVCPHTGELCWPVKAWKVSVPSWNPPAESLVMASTRAKAIARNKACANEAGYPLKWSDFRAVRSPAHDCLFKKHGLVNWSWDHLQKMVPNAK